MNKIFFNTNLPNFFIDEYMTKTNPIFSIIYIWLFRQFSKGCETIDINYISSELDILESDIRKSIEYWEKNGLISLDFDKNNKISLSFFYEINRNANNETEIFEDSKKMEEKSKGVRDLKKYSKDEIEKHLEDKEVQRLFFIVESLNGKLLTDLERKMYLGFYDDLGIPIDVIEVLVDYCVDNNKKNPNYLKSVAFDWADKAISTVDEAESYIEKYTGIYRKIMSFFGQGDRHPLKKEIEFMDTWLNDFKFTLTIIEKACEKSVTTIGSPKITYVNRILENWKNDSISTISDIENLEIEYYNKIENDKSKNIKKYPKKENSDSAYTDLEKMEWELAQQKYGDA